jgi:hypothetical protein
VNGDFNDRNINFDTLLKIFYSLYSFKTTLVSKYDIIVKLLLTIIISSLGISLYSGKEIIYYYLGNPLLPFSVLLLIYLFIQNKITLTLTKFDILFFGSAFILSLSVILNPMMSSKISLLRITNFVVLYYILREIITFLKGRSDLILTALKASLLILCLFQIANVLFYFLNDLSPFIHSREYYYGLVPIQNKFLSSHPNMACLFIFFLIYFFIFLSGKKDPTLKAIENRLFLAISMFFLITTQTKSIILFTLILVGYFIFNFRTRLIKIFWVVSPIILFSYFFIIHYFPVKSDNPEKKEYLSNYFDLRFQGIKIDKFVFLQTYYTTNKKTALQCFIDNPFFGIGPSEYNKYIDNLKLQNKYPRECKYIRPHCTYLGLAAGFGLFGIFSIILLSAGIIYSVKNLNNYKSQIFYAFLFLTLGIEAIYTDIEFNNILCFSLALLGSKFED